MAAFVAYRAAAAVVGPVQVAPDPRAVADRVHRFTVLVTARASIGLPSGTYLDVRTMVSTSSGVLLEGGLILTDLHAVGVTHADGAVDEASDIMVVIDGVGPVSARLAGGSVASGLAVLLLPDGLRHLPGAALASVDLVAGDPAVAMAVIGDAVKVLPVAIEHATTSGADGGRAFINDSLAPPFQGGPLFNERGEVGGVCLGAREVAAASVLRDLLQRTIGL